MPGHLPPREVRAAEDRLRELSSLLDAALEPVKLLDVRRVEENTRQQQELIEQLGPILDEEIDRRDVDGGLVAEVRHKLLRNRVLVTHVLDFAARLQARMSGPKEEGYSSDGQALAADAAGRLLRTSV